MSGGTSATRIVYPVCAFLSCVVGLNFSTRVVAQPAPAATAQWRVPESQILPETRPRRLQVIDANQDSFPDLVTYSMRAAEIWQNDQLGGFEKIATFDVGEQFLDLEPGDWDGDGALDFLTVGPRPPFVIDGVIQAPGVPLTIWLNRGERGFVRGDDFFLGGPDVKHEVFRVAAGDFNGDGRDDFIAAGTLIQSNGQQPVRNSIRSVVSASVFLSAGDGRFEAEAPIYANDPNAGGLVRLGDVDADGDLDFVGRILDGEGRQVWLNSGDGRFEIGQEMALLPEGFDGFPGYGLDRRMFDVDGDGDLDIIVPGVGSPNYLYLNDGQGQFKAEFRDGLGHFARLAAMQDLNADGLIDFIGNGDSGSFGYDANTAYPSPVSVRLAHADGGFDAPRPVSGAFPLDFVVRDFNGDQARDILVLSEFGIEVWLQGEPAVEGQGALRLVEIEDPKVRQRIGLILAKDPDLITVGDLATIKELDLSELALTRVTLPEGLTRMETLNLDKNRIASVSLPEDASAVRLITARENRVPTFTLEGAFPALQRLVWTGRNAEELRINGDVPQLENLSLWDTRVRDLRFLSKLSSLRVLNLGSMGLETLYLPQGIPNLSELSLSRNRSLDAIVVPRGFQVDRLIGADAALFVPYEDAFVGEGRARITGFEAGGDSLLEILVTAGPGTYRIEFSSSLDSWEPIGEFTHTTVESSPHALAGRESAVGFYRAVRVEP